MTDPTTTPRHVGRCFAVGLAVSLWACAEGAPRTTPPPVSELDMTTWSIAALDPETGAVGVAMASCVPETFGDAVAALVPGVGVAATQAAWNLENRNRVYQALQEGLGAQAVIDRATDPLADSVTARRQYAVVTLRDGRTEVAGFTGEGTSAWTGIRADRALGVSAQGNTLVSEAVVGDALAAYRRAPADGSSGAEGLADRLMRALEAGSAAGGDIRCNRDGITSTAATAMILVARGDDPPYAAVDIDVSDQGTGSAPWLSISHTTPREGPNPIVEVRRRFDSWRAGEASAYPRLSPQVQEFVASSASHVVVQGVLLVDGTGAPARGGMSVEIVDGRIERVGSAAEIGVPEGAEVVDGAGHTMIPGLVMLHEHLFYPSGQARYNTNEISFPPLYLAGGVTTMRTGGSVDTYTDLRVRQHIDEGRIPGPDIDVTGPYLEGPNGFVRAMPQLATPDEARAHVNFWMDQGVTSFKAYNLIDRATLRAAIEAAHARGAKVTGHLCSITYREAADLGIDNLEHGFFAATDWVADKQPDVCPRYSSDSYLDVDVEGAAFTGLVEHLIDRGVALTSTLTVVERRGLDRPRPPVGAQEAMLPQFRERVMAGLEQRPSAAGSARLAKFMAMEKAFYDAGGHLVVGTDPTGAGDVVAGYANQRALQLLVEMGLSVEQAVEVATRNGAVYLEQAGEIGTIEEGKRADFVLLRGDPSVDPEVFRAMTLVFKEGVGYDSEALFASVKGWVGVR